LICIDVYRGVEDMINVILCGGSGTRLWPLSKKLLPKQFIKLFNNGSQSLFQQTVLRNATKCQQTLIIANEKQSFLAEDQMEELKDKLPKNHSFRVITEGVGRNTAPAIALAALSCSHESDLLLVTPSDHIIKDRASYESALARAEEVASSGALVTFGLKPSHAETGYGYIEASGENVLSFREKPDEVTAKRYMEDGNYYWNSGMFVFSAKAYLEELKKHSLEIFEAAANVASRKDFHQKLNKINSSKVRSILSINS
jgi:mannose-1-phosphate guanylyltransferase